MGKGQPGHEGAIQDVLHAGRVLSAAVIVYHSVLAEKLGLSPTEEKAVDLLQRHGPLTAGELADKSGLAPPSVTGLVKRLEHKGFVRRLRDGQDGRKVRVEMIAERLQDFAPLFADLVSGITEICAGYSTAELQTIARFLNDSAARQHEAAAKLPKG